MRFEAVLQFIHEYDGRLLGSFPLEARNEEPRGAKPEVPQRHTSFVM